jgi:hypothetical protein
MIPSVAHEKFFSIYIESREMVQMNLLQGRRRDTDIRTHIWTWDGGGGGGGRDGMN